MIDNESEDESNYYQSNTLSFNEEHLNVSYDNKNNREPLHIKRQKNGNETEEEKDEEKANVLNEFNKNKNVKTLKISNVCIWSTIFVNDNIHKYTAIYYDIICISRTN